MCREPMASLLPHKQQSSYLTAGKHSYNTVCSRAIWLYIPKNFLIFINFMMFASLKINDV